MEYVGPMIGAPPERGALFFALTVLLPWGCGGSSADAPRADHPTPAAQGRHGAHAHDSPEDLRPLMHDLRRWLGEVQTALEAEQLADAAQSAEEIATACDDVDVQHFDPDQFGPRFAEIDRELHTAAAALGEALRAGDEATARRQLRAVTAACVSCHQQAPTAAEVDLGGLASGSAPSEDATPTTYRIDGTTVSRAAFEALRDQLEVSTEPSIHGDLVNEDGSYGGSEATYPAVHRETRASYQFTEAQFTGPGGQRSRELSIQGP